MSKTLAIMLTATLAVAVAAVTTTMQIQPAYSQATHCTTNALIDRSTCVTPGKDPSATICSGTNCIDRDVTHQEAGQLIGRGHQGCAQGFGECTVGNPNE